MQVYFIYLPLKAGRIKLLVDENIVFNNDYLFILICNTIHTGKGMKAAPKAKFNDGLLSIISVNSKNIVPPINKVIYSNFFWETH